MRNDQEKEILPSMKEEVELLRLERERYTYLDHPDAVFGKRGRITAMRVA